MKTHHHKTRHGIIVGIWIAVGFLVGLVIAVIFFNYIEHNKDTHLEITFVTPRQAIIFWKSENPSIGYVMYGETKHSMNTKVLQTSSTPTDTHAVVLEDLPLEGAYISLHTDTESKLLWPELIQLQFDPTTIE